MKLKLKICLTFFTFGVVFVGATFWALLTDRFQISIFFGQFIFNINYFTVLFKYANKFLTSKKINLLTSFKFQFFQFYFFDNK